MDEKALVTSGALKPLKNGWSRVPTTARLLLPGLALLITYFVLSLLNSPFGTLGPDTGGKVATLKAMGANHTFTNVDVGYWAARWDPQGVLHPLFRTTQVGPHWIQVTTLPMVLVGEPLWRLGGYRAALLLPICGAIACAYAARTLAGRFGAPSNTRWAAFWIIGLASPVTIYALDFWEHTIGLALMAWGVVALLDLLDAHSTTRRWVYAGGAGLAFGTAATMRTEALVYLVITAATVGVVLLARERGVIRWLIPASGLIIGSMLPLVVNALANEWIIGDEVRVGRSAGAVGRLGSGLGTRLREGLTITFGLFGSTGTAKILTGVLATLLIGLAVAWGRSRSAPTVRLIVVCLGCCLLYVFTFADGLGWVNGLVATAPLAAAGAVVAWRPPLRSNAAVAATAVLLSLPMVWLVRWTGGQALQWSGRYILCTMLVLVAIGAVALPSLRRPVPGVLVSLSVAVTLFGLIWLNAHTHNVDRLFTTLDARHEPVLVADAYLADLPREGGAFYGEHRWLAALQPWDRTRAATVVDRAGFTEFGLVHLSRESVPSHVGTFDATGSTSIGDYQGVPITITTFRHRPRGTGHS